MTITVWHLEILDRTAFQRSAEPLQFRLEQVTVPVPAFLTFLYVATATPGTGPTGFPWTYQQWRDRQADPGVEFWVAYDGARRQDTSSSRVTTMAVRWSWPISGCCRMR